MHFFLYDLIVFQNYNFCFTFQQMENQKKIDAKRSKLEEKKRKLLNELKNNALHEVMTLERETILALHITELLEQLKSGELDPLAVLQAYQVLSTLLIIIENYAFRF